jgi:hypothetical protein
MDIDLLNIQPTTISRDLKGKYLLLYGAPKSGKTTFACQLPRNLLIACERGYNALSGVKAVDITKWTDFKKVVKQLAKEEVKAAYDSISIDTVGILWDLCEQYICMQNNVDGLTEIPWGKGYALCKKEFEGSLRTITMLGYGLALIAHVETRTEKDSAGNDVEFIGPALMFRAA